MRTLYCILNVRPIVSAEDMRGTYLDLAKLHHPDRGGDPSIMGEITAAYSVLKDPQLRVQYDRLLKLRGKQCRDCEGSGVKFKTISFTRKSAFDCPACEGTGQADCGKGEMLNAG